jgi:hypothetical protein
MPIVAGKVVKTEVLREVLSSKRNGNQYEIWGNTPLHPVTELVKLSVDRRCSKRIKKWEANWIALEEMSPDEWQPDDILKAVKSEEMPPMMEVPATGSDMVKAIEFQLIWMREVREVNYITSYIPDDILVRAILKGEMDLIFLRERR